MSSLWHSFVSDFQVTLLGDCMGALLAYDALCTINNFSRSRAYSMVSNSSASSVSVPQTCLATPMMESSEASTSKTRRISSHLPPVISNLETSKSLRLSLSSGNIREVCEVSRSPTEPEYRPSSASPEVSKQSSRRQTFSFDTLSLSVDSVDFASFDFEVAKFFAFGSPIGLVIAYRRCVNGEDKMAGRFSRGHSLHFLESQLSIHVQYMEL